MSGPVTYRRDESIAMITMDDGKVNALGPPMQQALNEALDLSLIHISEPTRRS